MAENSFIETEKVPFAPQETIKAKPKKPAQASLFTRMEEKLSFENLLSQENINTYLKQFAWLILLGVVYIFNSHVSERLSRERDILTKLVEDLRTHYTTLHADVMYESKESEVVNKVKELGITSNTAPQKIVFEQK